METMCLFSFKAFTVYGMWYKLIHACLLLYPQFDIIATAKDAFVDYVENNSLHQTEEFWQCNIKLHILHDMNKVVPCVTNSKALKENGHMWPSYMESFTLRA